MGKQEVHRALVAMDDDAVRARLAEGDFGAVEGLELTDEEQALVQGAAADYPEVAGFSLSNYLAPQGSTQPFLKVDNAFLKIDSANPGLGMAIKFLKID